MKVLDAIWFSSKDTIGMVAIKNEVDEIKFYIGSVKFPSTEEEDSLEIARNGAKVHPNMIESFIKSNLKK